MNKFEILIGIIIGSIISNYNLCIFLFGISCGIYFDRNYNTDEYYKIINNIIVECKNVLL